MTNGATVSSRTVRWKLGEEGLVGRIAARNHYWKRKIEWNLQKNTRNGQRKIGIKCCGLMSPSLNSLATSKECMSDGGRGRDIKISLSCQQLNTEGVVWWCGVPFQPQEQVTVKIDGVMDKKVYHNILVRHGVPSGSRLIGPGFIFQEDNDPKHSSNYCRNYLRQKESAETLKIMDWPPQSPDLNPIEQIWGSLENKLDRSIVHSKESLWLELQKAWDNYCWSCQEIYWHYAREMCCCNCCRR